jgi:hypothetical protein
VIAEEETVRGAPSSDSKESDPTRDGAAMLRYLLTLSGVMALLYITPFFFARSALYDRVNPSFFARPLNYAFETAGQNADVVIFGDSTALLGIDPSRMSSALGVKVLNLVNTQPTLVVNDDLSLRRYLQANRPPRLIVFYFAPWDFDFGHNDFDSWPTYDGEEILLRHGNSREIVAFVRNHPHEAAVFPLKFYLNAWQFTLHHVPHAHQEEQLRATRGHVDSPEPSIMTVPCHFPQYLIDHVRFNWVHDLGGRYRSPQTQVLFYVAPVPACDNVSEVLARPYGELPAAPPKTVPPVFFMKDVRVIHPRPVAVPELTRNLTDAVRPILAPIPAPVPAPVPAAAFAPAR